MARASSDDVKAILLKNYDSINNPSLAPFIATATALTDWLESQDEDGELSDDLLLQIETYLAAHFYAHGDQLYQSKNTGRASGVFQGKTEMGLKSTQYGQAAISLDSTGILGSRDGKVRVSGFWGGIEPSTDWPEYR